MYLARDQHDRFRESGALANLAADLLGQQHYDESIEYGENSLAISQPMDYQLYVEKAKGTLGFDYLKLGDFGRASQLS